MSQPTLDVPFTAGVPDAVGTFFNILNQRIGNGVHGRGLDFKGHISWVSKTWQPVYPNPLLLFPSATAAGVSHSLGEKMFIQPLFLQSGDMQRQLQHLLPGRNEQRL